MRSVIVCCLTMAAAAVLMPADTTTPPPKVKKTAPKAAKAPAPLTVPKDAVQVDANTWHYTDPEGKKWTYRATPFGIARLEDKPVTAEEVERTKVERDRLLDSTTAVEDGDVIRFQRPGPFGVYKWEKKKTDLNETEQAVWKRASGKKSAPAGKPQE